MGEAVGHIRVQTHILKQVRDPLPILCFVAHETVDDQDRRRRRITMSPQLLKVIEDFLDASLQTFEKRRVFS